MCVVSPLLGKGFTGGSRKGGFTGGSQKGGFT